MANRYQPPRQPNMADLLKQAQKMQEQLMEARAAAEEAEVEGQAGGGMVKIRVTGAMVFTGVSINPEAFDPDDPGMLEDLVLAALRDATSKVGELSESAMGGMNLPGMDLGAVLGGAGGLGGAGAGGGPLGELLGG
ncbi:MAG: YbaB/EbfC family nucleoid-associated protein [Acidimicrobiales bacterium]